MPHGGRHPIRRGDGEGCSNWRTFGPPLLFPPAERPLPVESRSSWRGSNYRISVEPDSFGEEQLLQLLARRKRRLNPDVRRSRQHAFREREDPFHVQLVEFRGVLRHLGERHLLTESVSLTLVCVAIDPLLEEEGIVELVEFGLERADCSGSVLSLLLGRRLVLLPDAARFRSPTAYSPALAAAVRAPRRTGLPVSLWRCSSDGKDHYGNGSKRSACPWSYSATSSRSVHGRTNGSGRIHVTESPADSERADSETAHVPAATPERDRTLSR